jgi:hypothetical protein
VELVRIDEVHPGEGSAAGVRDTNVPNWNAENQVYSTSGAWMAPTLSLVVSSEVRDHSPRSPPQ